MNDVVLLRQKQLNGDNVLVRCQVLEKDGRTMRVVPEGTKKPIDVLAADTIPASKVFGNRINSNSAVPQSFPPGVSALGNVLR